MRKFVIVSMFFIVSAFVSITAVYADEAPQTKLEKLATPLVGTPYQYGGSTTNAFDCSGFSSYIFEQIGIELTRSSSSQAQMGEPVKKSELRAGDLLFFKTNGYSISHVGIYIGDNNMIHASTNNGVEIRNINETYYANSYVSARRVLNQQQYEAWATIPQPKEKPQPKQAATTTKQTEDVTENTTLQTQKEQWAKSQETQKQDSIRMQQNQKMKEIFLQSIDNIPESIS